jgi:hypothetical protein
VEVHGPLANVDRASLGDNARQLARFGKSKRAGRVRISGSGFYITLSS